MRIYNKEGSLKRYLKDMEQCQIRLYKKCKELDNRIIELERNNEDNKEVKKEVYPIVPVKCSSCQYDRGYPSDAWCKKQNPNHSINGYVKCKDYKKIGGV